ncbi:MAG: sodium/solute symporter, partial [Planctomycetota bacterium]|nr:sodium/solute symporter [Planctomycetota bacterium]
LAALALVDWLVVAGYGLAVILIAVWAKRRQKGSADYLLGGGRLPWWAVGVSIIATAFSSISLVTWTGLAYYQGARWMQLQLGELAAIVVVSSLFLPYFARLDITTAYAYLDQRFGRAARWIASGMFHVVVLARAGLFLFLTAQVLSVFADLPVAPCIVIVGVAALIYSSTGGLGAVVWTDALQMLLVVGGVGAALWLVVGELPGGVADLGPALGGAGKKPLYDLSLDLGDWPTLLAAVFAYGTFAVAVGGTNQQAVQRYLACADLRASRRAAFLSWGVGALVTALTLGLGVALYARFGADPDHVLNASVQVDRVFATFVEGHLPVGLAGILAAAIFAASMSSVDSAIHSMATATLVDFIEPLRASPLSDEKRLRMARLLTSLYGVLAVLAALVAMQQGRHVFDLLLAWLGYLIGPILGLFLLGMLTRWVGHWQAVVGVLAGYMAVILGFTTLLLDFTPEGAEAGKALTWAAHNGVHGIWAALTGCAATMGTGIVLSLGRIGGKRA